MSASHPIAEIQTETLPKFWFWSSGHLSDPAVLRTAHSIGQAASILSSTRRTGSAGAHEARALDRIAIRLARRKRDIGAAASRGDRIRR
jgi:hypothetical protein